jgi:hypothetical protein
MSDNDNVPTCFSVQAFLHQRPHDATTIDHAVPLVAAGIGGYCYDEYRRGANMTAAHLGHKSLDQVISNRELRWAGHM